MKCKSCIILLIMGLCSLFNWSCNSSVEYVGEVQTYWVNTMMITDYQRDNTCSVYWNKNKHFYEIEYNGTRYELVKEIPLDVNGDGTLILRYRFKNLEHYIKNIPN